MDKSATSKEIGPNRSSPAKLNQAAIPTVSNPIYHEGTKHIKVLSLHPIEDPRKCNF